MEPATPSAQHTSPHLAHPHSHREQLQAQLSFPSSESSVLSPPPPAPAADAPKAAIRLKFKLNAQPAGPPPPSQASQDDTGDLDAEGEEDIDSDDPEDDAAHHAPQPHPPPPPMARSSRPSSSRAPKPQLSESEFEEEVEEDEASFSDEEDEAPVKKRGAITTTSKKSRSRSQQWHESDDDEEEYQDGPKKRTGGSSNKRNFVVDDEEDEEEEYQEERHSRPLAAARPRQILKFPPRREDRQDSLSSSGRPTRGSRGRASADTSATEVLSNGIRRSSRAANIPPEFTTDGAAGATGDGGDFDDGAAAFVEPVANGGGPEGEDAAGEEEEEQPTQPSYKDLSASDIDEDDDAPINTGRRLARGSTLTSRPPPRNTRNSRRVQIAEVEESDGVEPGTRKLRERKSRPDYVLLPPSSEPADSGRSKGGGRRQGGSTGGGFNHIPWNSNGKELSRHLGMPQPGGDDSSDDGRVGNTPRKAAPAPNMFGPTIGGAAGGMFGGAPPPLDMGTGPSNMGKVGDAALSDADPLGVNAKVTFDSVGGLDTHIQQLKEMVSLPLLYPELFLRFKVTPPRGVLFHGPPGTGKTLVARALAASCSTGGTKISFFMRKGADCLSKWVGEAERQLRLLFEEARACQPSIIFFDEIDGLAPVRSSKQDQIHASIVSTLLALMDGMDGRGQVIVIGATNRPDAVDPALRRPGRFDREFYFPLPNKTARRKILDIHTGGWEPALGDAFLDNLAGITKGYGGADLRALCTEASLNAIQRRYPQIYKTNERLLLEPESISVQAKDFMISVKNLIPSSARATASAAAPLPTQLVPLLSESLSLATKAIDKALPPIKKRNVLEEAEWETDDPNEGSFEKEMMLQSLESLRVYRPRVLIHGEPGSGQSYIGAAVLHHLEGFHVQSLDIGTLMGDSTRSIEAAIVQLFVEAKRHKPSVLYIPSLSQWAHTMTEMARSTVKALLDSLAPSDPVMLLAVVDGNLDSLPRDVKAWFGYSKENRVALKMSSQDQRTTFFADLLANVSKPPNEFPDAVPKRKRVLEVLPIAPPLPVRGPSAAELAALLENDARLREHVKWRLGPVLTELKKRYRRSLKLVQDQFDNYNAAIEHIEAVELEEAAIAASAAAEAAAADPDVAEPSSLPNGINGHVSSAEAMVVDVDGVEQVVQKPAEVYERPRRPHDIDLEKMHEKLYYDRYLTAEQFLEDVQRIVENAELDIHDNERLWKAKQMLNQANLLVDASCDAGFRAECQKMAAREKEREKERKDKQREEKGKGKEKDGSIADGVRQSARGAGKEPEFGATDPAALERALKRQREGSASAPSGAEGELPPPKRVRVDGEVEGEAGPSGTVAAVTDDVDMGDDTVTAAAPDASSNTVLVASQSTIVPSSSQPGSPLVPTLPGTPTPSTLLLSTDAVSTTPTGLPLPAPAAEVEAAAPLPPPPPPPPFVLPNLASLQKMVHVRTAKLNVEQLEQLRAMLLDVVWRRRADWDRAEMVEEMVGVAEEFVGEVEADAEEGEWAD